MELRLGLPLKCLLPSLIKKLLSSEAVSSMKLLSPQIHIKNAWANFCLSVFVCGLKKEISQLKSDNAGLFQNTSSLR